MADLVPELQELVAVVGPAPATPIVANGSAGGTIALPTRAGWIVSCKVDIRGTGTVAPPGRYFAIARILNPSTGEVIGTIWQGYVIAGCSPVSIPNLAVAPGYTLGLAVYAGSNGDPAQTIEARAQFTSVEPTKSGTSLYIREPFSGDGELYQIAFVQPAAGADFANQQVPTFVRWRVVSIGAQLSTGAAVANRFWVVEYKKATIVFFRSCAGGTQPAGAAATGWSGFIGGAPAAVDQVSVTAANQYSFGLPNTKLQVGDIIQFVTANVQGTDQWDPNSIDGMFVEEWAGPTAAS
jgi:hypothetical protein